MTSKIKVDNIENQCGGAVVTKCGGTTTISGTVVKSNTLQASDAGNIINQSGTTITLGASGDTINLASGASQSGFGRTGTVDWITTPKTATFTAVSGEGYFCNTSGGAFTVNLPAGVAGAIISVADYAATWQTSNLTVSPNGTEKIGGTNVDVNLDTEGQSVTFVYVDATQGWINTMDSTSNVRGSSFVAATVSGSCNSIVTNGNFKTAIFKGPGTFCVSSSGTGSNTVEYFVIAGGGGGGDNGGGGGGGGFRLYTTAPGSNSPLNNPSNALPVSVQGYTVAVGAGGPSSGSNGSVSTFSSITSTGGGGGGPTSSPRAGNPGGSGGGTGRDGGGESGGSGNTPPVSPAQGTNGGAAGPGVAYVGGGGGGGAIAVGTNGTGGCSGSERGGNGGSGSYIADSLVGPTAPSYGTPGPVGSTRFFSGGAGGGASNLSPGTGGDSSSGGGGAGGKGNPGTDGTVNTGGGGGGGSDTPPASGGGGSGIVMIRYKFQ